MNPVILYAEDEERFQHLVVNFLKKNGYDVLVASDGEEAVDLFFDHPEVNLVLLDIMMPRLNGIDVLKIIREESEVPVIMITALGEEENEIGGLAEGADDYITKPFSYPIFKARIAAQLRRQKKHDEELFTQDDLIVNIDKREVSIDGKTVELTPNEYELLVYLLRNQNRALSRDMILDGVWGMDFEGDWRNVDTHVKRLRSKLGTHGSQIKTVYGYGYRWEKL